MPHLNVFCGDKKGGMRGVETTRSKWLLAAGTAPALSSPPRRAEAGSLRHRLSSPAYRQPCSPQLPPSVAEVGMLRQRASLPWAAGGAPAGLRRGCPALRTARIPAPRTAPADRGQLRRRLGPRLRELGAASQLGNGLALIATALKSG